MKGRRGGVEVPARVGEVRGSQVEAKVEIICDKKRRTSFIGFSNQVHESIHKLLETNS